jgi:copper homeostasis protein
MEPLLQAAKGKGLTLHRCIDVSRNPVETYQLAHQLGFDTVLTSGAAASCLQGEALLGQLLQLRDDLGGPEVLIGAGVNTAAIRHFRSHFPNARAFHMSGKMELESEMRFRRTGVPMGLPGLDEWHIQQTDPKKVRAARLALDNDR